MEIINRVNLSIVLNSIIPTYSIGQIRGTINEDCCVLRKGVDIPSTNNSKGHWDNWYIDIYSPFSPINVDDIVTHIKHRLLEITNVEIEQLINGDYYDEVLRAYSTSMSIRIPNIY